MNKQTLFIVIAVIIAAGLGIWVMSSPSEKSTDAKPVMKKADQDAPSPAKPTAPVETEKKPETIPQQTIVDIAIANGNFTTLVKAVQAAGLVETLSGKGPFTVFAPTDAAFAKLPAGTVEALLKDKAKLTSILTYHVVSGKVMTEDVVKLTSAKTLNGQSVAIDSKSGVKVNDATVVTADVDASNGVIHVIDTVLLPK